MSEDCCGIEGEDAGERGAAVCPSCGRKGRPVGAVTIKSLVRPEALAKVPGADGFRFCATPACEVAYYRAEPAHRIAVAEVRVPIGAKLAGPDRPVCYCFEYSAGEIEEEVRRSGGSRVPADIAAKCKQGLDRCPETNPKGSCCLGDVNAVVKAAKERLAEASAPESAGARGDAAGGTRSQRAGLVAGAGAVLAAVLASACCWLPLLLVAIGASAAGAGEVFQAWRPALLGASAVLLAAGFYQVYVRAPRCEEGGACGRQRSKLERFSRGSLWVATALIGVTAFFPKLTTAALGGTHASEGVQEAAAETLFLHVDGMSCEACAASIRSELEQLPGVLGADVSLPRQLASVYLAPGAEPPSQETLEGAIGRAGYQGTLLPGEPPGTRGGSPNS